MPQICKTLYYSLLKDIFIELYKCVLQKGRNIHDYVVHANLAYDHGLRLKAQLKTTYYNRGAEIFLSWRYKEGLTGITLIHLTH